MTRTAFQIAVPPRLSYSNTTDTLHGHDRFLSGWKARRGVHHGARTGSNLDGLLADACAVVSCLIQHGVEPRSLPPAWAGW